MTTKTETGLVRYDEMLRSIERALAEVQSLDDVTDLRKQAEVLRSSARVAKNREAERKCAEIRLRAEHRWGQIYLKHDKQHGARGRGSNQHRKVEVESHDGTPPTLDELGISKSDASRWKRIGEVNDKDFERVLKKLASSGGMPTTAGVLKSIGKTVKENPPKPKPAPKPPAEKPPRYSVHVVLAEEGLVKSRATGGKNKAILAELHKRYPDVEHNNPAHEQRVRAFCRELFAERYPEAAGKKAEAIKETFTPPQLKTFSQKADAILQYEVHRLLVAELKRAFGEERARLDEREAKLEEWAKTLNDRERDVTTYMTEEEFKIVLGCLHPDRAGGDEVLSKRLNKAFEIFRRLEKYIRKYPVAVLRERGWA